MKYKFHEDLPSPDYPTEQWADIRTYVQEVNWICKNAGWDFNKIKIDDTTFGEPVLFYKGQYAGYLDQYFYLCYDENDWETYWGFDN